MSLHTRNLLVMTLDQNEKKELIAVIEGSNANYARFNWTALAIMITALIAVMGWAISVESRLTEYKASMNLNERVKNLEELMVPVLVDYKVKKEMEKLEAERAVRRAASGKSKGPAMVAPNPVPPVIDAKIEEKARNWAEDQVWQR